MMPIKHIPMESDAHLRAADIRQMMQLTHESRELAGDLNAKSHHFFEGIRKLINAQVCIFSELSGYFPEKKWHIRPIFDFGWNLTAERKIFMSFFDSDQMSDPLTQRCVFLEDQTTTVSRRSLVNDTQWYESPNVMELRRPGGLDDCIYSCYRLRDPETAMGVAFHRPWGDTAFGVRERLIVHLMHEFNPLYNRRYVPENASSKLSRRQQQVLNLLQQGYSEKEAANHLALSKHTVHVYVKGLYKHFSVYSRAELLSLWVNRDLHQSRTKSTADD
jgi:DNA-binding CsgD family transcriptional regulator